MPKEVFTISAICHRDQNCLKIDFERNEEIVQKLREIPGLRWSQTHRAWYVPETEKEKLSAVVKSISNVTRMAPIKGRPLVPAITQSKRSTPALPPINELHRQKSLALERWMRSRRYSENTITTYSEALRTFLRYFSNKAAAEIDNQDLVDFNNDYILKNHLSASYQNQVVNSVKLYFRTVENKLLSPELIHRPKRARTLPNVLSKEEVKALLSALNNIKHKTMLSLIYACGLRCGELLCLTPNHLDANRKLLIIKRAKGQKDRIVPLSIKIMMLLQEYREIHKPINYLFEGQVKGQMYDARSLQQVLKHAVQKAGILKSVTLHWLRHSYATHLLENGTDLRYIQEILGHNSSRTTEIYTHVSNLSIQKIVSPYDNL